MKTFDINIYGKTPAEVQSCRSMLHTVKHEQLGRCYSRYTCDTCNIQWSVDSSD